MCIASIKTHSLARKSALLIPLIFGLLSSHLAAAENCDYKAGPPDAGIATSANPTGADNGITTAWFGDATTLYHHGVLGDKIEAHTLYVHTGSSKLCALEITLDDSSVFEDVTPRIADVTGDGLNNIIVIESHKKKGASLAVYGIQNQRLEKIASTPYIGRSSRWLAPAGIADFNGDNVNDVAYVQTPHIGGILKIWSFKGETPLLLASKSGFSNHRIGENFITGGLRHCDGKITLVIPNQQWTRTLTARMTGDSIITEVYANRVDEDTIDRASQCP